MVSSNRLMNPQAITGIFGRMPLLKRSELLTLQMKRDGPSLYIQIGTKETIEKKPVRWDEWDIVYIEISFWGVNDLEIHSFGTFNEIEQFLIEDGKESSSITIQCSNGMSISCLFDWARVERITPGLIGG
jgi:Immunity protein 50